MGGGFGDAQGSDAVGGERTAGGRASRRRPSCHVHVIWYVRAIVNTPKNVNIASSASLERRLLAKLVEILLDIDWLTTTRLVEAADSDADAVVRLSLGGRAVADLHVDVKREHRPATFLEWAARREASHRSRGGIRVLAMPHVSPRLADLCRRAGWSWFDLAGNCRLDVPQLLHVERSGHAPIERTPSPAANLGTAAAGRVLRAVLSPAHAGQTWTQRRLQSATCWKASGDDGVSLGLVNKVVRHLTNEGFVEVVDPHGLRVCDPEGLLAAWRDAYRFDRHERRGFFTLLKPAQLDAALARFSLEAGGMAAYAAFSAADRQAPNVRQHRTWLFVTDAELEKFARHAMAKEVDSGENIVVLIPNDSGVLVSFEVEDFATPRLSCTDPVQTYIDLHHCGSRGEEAAEAILEQRLRPAWRRARSD